MIYNNKEGIKVDGGWMIGTNVFENVDFDNKENLYGNDIYLDSTLLLGANNYIQGKTFEMTYENSEVGYEFNLYYLNRNKGIWEYDETSYLNRYLENSHDVNAFNEIISRELNPFGKDLIPLKIGSWKINQNNFLSDITQYKTIELLFSAIREELFIEVVYYKNKVKPFNVYYGIANEKYHGITYELYQDVRSSKGLNFETLNEVVDFLNQFLLNKKMI